MAKRQPTARAGKRLGRYVIEKELGRGGMGVVYLARDENLGRLVALKTTSVAGLGSAEKTRNQRRQRFIREVQALGQVSHENVVHVYDAGEEDDPDLGWLLFYSMQYVEGITLAELVQRKGPLDAGAAAAVCAQVAYGLGAGHQRGIVHRDVKPANIFLSHAGRALIGDFGIAKIEGSTQITRRDQLVGTPNYLAPEQILGEQVTAATDVFALGALFYVIVSNRPLRTKLDAAALLAAAKGNDAKETILAEAAVPAGLRKVVARALERETKRRWTDGTHFGDALSEFASRIPPLDDELTQDTRKPTASSSDDHDAFATRSEEIRRINKADRPPSRTAPSPQRSSRASSSRGASAGGSPFSAVEEAARALLHEVGQNRSPSSKKEEAAPLPVARTESTVMFNLRAMEEKEGKKPKAEEDAEDGPLLEPVESAAALPVARTESTVVFNLRNAQRTPADTADVTDPDAQGDTLDPMSDVGDDDDDGEASDHNRGFESNPTPPVTVAHHDITDRRPVAQPIVREVVPERLPRVLPPLDERRVKRIGATSLGGAFLGLLVLLTVRFAFGAGPMVLPKPVQERAVAQETRTAREMPEHCGQVARNDGDKASAKVFVDAAMKLKGQGKDADVRRSLERALALDGANAYAHYQLAQLIARVDDDPTAARKQYECVVVLEPDSELGQKAAKAIGVSGRAR